MQNHYKISKILALVLIINSPLYGCMSSHANSQPNINYTTQQRFIVAFKQPQQDPEAAKMLLFMSETFGSNVTFIRRMANNAAVYSVSFSQSKTDFSDVLKLLQENDAIEYAEPDQRRQIQTGKTR